MRPGARIVTLVHVGKSGQKQGFFEADKFLFSAEFVRSLSPLLDTSFGGG